MWRPPHLPSGSSVDGASLSERTLLISRKEYNKSERRSGSDLTRTSPSQKFKILLKVMHRVEPLTELPALGSKPGPLSRAGRGYGFGNLSNPQTPPSKRFLALDALPIIAFGTIFQALYILEHRKIVPARLTEKGDALESDRAGGGT